MDLVKELSANQRVLIRRLVTDQIVDKVEEVQVYSAAGPQVSYCCVSSFELLSQT